MSSISLAVNRSSGRCLIVGQAACRRGPAIVAQRQGLSIAEAEDPYDAMAQLCRRPLFYSAVIISLNSLYREELQLISSVKRRFSHMEIWLSHTDGRQAALAEAMRLGADGLMDDDGLHRIGPGIPPAETSALPLPTRADVSRTGETAMRAGDSVAERQGEKVAGPILTAEELHALLQEHPAAPGDA